MKASRDSGQWRGSIVSSDVCSTGTLRRRLLGAAAAAVLMLAVADTALADAASDAATMQKLQQQIELLQKQQQQQIEALQRQVEELKKKQADTATPVEPQQERVAPANVVTGGDFPGSFKLPGTETSVAIHGYAKADFFYDVNGKLGDSVFFSTLPFKGSQRDKDGGFRAHVKQTRFSIETRTPTDWGTLKTLVEGDFFGGSGNETVSNSSVFRLRHAYGEFDGGFGDLLIGQSWSTFLDVDAYPWTVDFFGPVGVPFIRQVQARYTYKFGEGTSVAFAIENPEPDFVRDQAGADPAPNNENVFFFTNSPLEVDNEIPDFVVRARHEEKWGWVQGGAVLRRMNIDDGIGDDSVFAYGLTASGTYNVTDADTVGFIGLFGDGIGRYNITGSGTGAVEVNPGTPDLELKTLTEWGASAWYKHNWRDNLWSDIVFGYTGTDFENISVAALNECGICNERIFSLHVNTFWEPFENVLFGLEYIRGWGEHETLGDRRGNRIQFAAQYDF